MPFDRDRSCQTDRFVDASTGLAETLEAVKDAYESSPYAGIACAMKNAGVGVGLPDWGRARLLVRNGRVEIHSGASCIGQGLGNRSCTDGIRNFILEARRNLLRCFEYLDSAVIPELPVQDRR